jgi:signal peptidase I
MMNNPNRTIRPILKNQKPYLVEILSTFIFLVASLSLFDMAIPRSVVDGSSMLPTFVDGERLIVSRLDYLFRSPDRGDVIVLNSVDPREPEVMLIKRVVGLPGETIELRDQQVYIDGVLLEEPYIREACTVSKCADESWQLAETEYFVMGDNRNHSRDSRDFGVIPIDHIVGHVVIRFWPINRVGLVYRVGL